MSISIALERLPLATGDREGVYARVAALIGNAMGSHDSAVTDRNLEKMVSSYDKVHNIRRPYSSRRDLAFISTHMGRVTDTLNHVKSADDRFQSVYGSGDAGFVDSATAFAALALGNKQKANRYIARVSELVGKAEKVRAKGSYAAGMLKEEGMEFLIGDMERFTQAMRDPVYGGCLEAESTALYSLKDSLTDLLHWQRGAQKVNLLNVEYQRLKSKPHGNPAEYSLLLAEAKKASDAIMSRDYSGRESHVRRLEEMKVWLSVKGDHEYQRSKEGPLTRALRMIPRNELYRLGRSQRERELAYRALSDEKSGLGDTAEIRQTSFVQERKERAPEVLSQIEGKKTVETVRPPVWPAQNLTHTRSADGTPTEAALDALEKFLDGVIAAETLVPPGPGPAPQVSTQETPTRLIPIQRVSIGARIKGFFGRIIKKVS